MFIMHRRKKSSAFPCDAELSHFNWLELISSVEITMMSRDSAASNDTSGEYKGHARFTLVYVCVYIIVSVKAKVHKVPIVSIMFQ